MIDIEVKLQGDTAISAWPLLDPLDLFYTNPTSVRVDGMEVLEFGYFQDGVWRLRHDRPFYRWRHEVTGQGWLLEPVKTVLRESSANG